VADEKLGKAVKNLLNFSPKTYGKDFE